MSARDDDNTIRVVSTDYPIESVTVYSARAEIQRLYTVSLSKGDNVIDIVQLPRCILENSVRVQGVGNATIHNVSVMNMPESEADSPQPQNSITIQDLKDNIDRVDNEVIMMNDQNDSVAKYMNTFSASGKNQINTVNVLQDLEKCMDYRKKLQNDIVEAKKELDKLKKRLERRKMEIRDIKKLSKSVKITCFANEDIQVNFVATYIVTNCRWNAFYNVRVDTFAGRDKNRIGDKNVEWEYRASISQDTGEIWENTKIRLDTSTAVVNDHVPSLSPWKLGVIEPKPPSQPSIFARSTRSKGTSANNTLFGSAAATAAAGSFADVQSAPEMETTSATALGVSTFDIDGRHTVYGNNVEHTVLITKLPLKGDIFNLIVPRISNRCYRKIILTNDADFKIEKGKASIYVDDSFIAINNVDATSTGGNIHLPIGINPDIRITSLPRIEKTSESGVLISKRFYNIHQRYEIKNVASDKSPQKDIKDIIVYDQVPISVNADVQVERIKPREISKQLTHLPSSSSSTAFSSNSDSNNVHVTWKSIADLEGEESGGGGEKEGIFRFVIDKLDFAKSQVLETIVQVSSPTSQKISGL